ncbi:MAG: Ig-like domain repeat protein, partial [Acidimicrobiales bacterium]
SGGGSATAVVTVNTSAAPGDQYAMVVYGVANPTSAASGNLSLSTSSDPTPVALSDDTAAAQPVGSPSVSLSDYVSGSTGVTYAVGFTTSGLDSGFSFGTDASTIILAAPAGTVFPSAGNAYQVTDNTTGTNATASGVTLSSSGATATVTVPVDVSPGGGVAVTITGVTNPAATGTQDLAISTTSDTQANAQYTLGAGGPISGSVTYQGSPVVGAPVQACPSSGPCATGTTDGSGQYSLLVIDGTYEMTAFPSTSVDASQGTAGPVVVSSSAGVSGVAVALSAPPSIPAGVTLTSPSFGTITSSTATPVINWHQPTEVSLDPSLFGPTGTHVVLHGFQVSGTSSVTGLRETEFLPVGGGSPSVASGGVFGPYGGCANSPGLVLAGPVTTEALYPFHGPAIITPEATVYPPGTPPEIEVAAPCSLFFPTENTGDTGTVYFTNFAAQGGITVGKGSIVGGDYKDFSITTAVTPPGTADCGNTLVDMPQDQTPSSDATPPGSQCGIGVHWVPVDGKHYEFSTLEVHVGPTLYPVELIACNDDAGVGQCDPDEEPPEPTDDQPPLPYPEPKPGPHINPYVDPSGTVQVQTPSGPAPLAGASVTLSGGPGQGGPFSPVPDGSAIMAPSNRQNPSVSDALGTFGWDTLAGYYQVSATKSGCDSAATNGFGVPPPVSDLSLTLTCTAPPVRAQTSTGLAASPTSATFGQLVTLTATVKRSGGGGPPPGAVTFLDGTTSLGQAVVDPTSGTAQLQTSVLPAGKHTITASYGGSGTDAPSTSTAVTVTVSSPGAPAPPCTAVSLTASPREAAIGTKVELTASAKGCTSATYTFTGIALIRGAASFTIGTTTSPSLAWDTTGARAAFYEVKVSARAPGQASAVTSSHQIVILYPPYRPKA